MAVKTGNADMVAERVVKMDFFLVEQRDAWTKCAVQYANIMTVSKH